MDFNEDDSSSDRSLDAEEDRHQDVASAAITSNASTQPDKSNDSNKTAADVDQGTMTIPLNVVELLMIHAVIVPLSDIIKLNVGPG